MRSGTPDHSREPRCNTCKHASIIRGYADSQVRVQCSVMANPKWPVYECSEYVVRGTLTLYQLNQMAWLIEPTKDGIGFTSRRMTDKERGEALGEDV